MRHALFALLLLLSARQASAQEAPGTQPAGPLTPASPAEEAPAARSRTLSFGLSAGSSLIGVGTFVSVVALSDGDCDDTCEALGTIGMLGTLFGPSAGHIYSGEYVHAFAASTLRFVALAAAGPPLAQAARAGTPLREVGAGPLIGGAVLAGLIVGDSLDALRAPARKAERRARRLERQRGAAPLSVAPLPYGGGGLGLQVSGGF
jgi:hypothetical protein